MTLNMFAPATIAVALFSITSTASAADFGNRQSSRSAPPPVAQKDWSGAYVGVHGALIENRRRNSGATSTNPALNFATPALPAVGKRNNRATTNGGGGIQAGYNFQNGNIVYGAEIEGTMGRGGKRRSATNLTAQETSRIALKGKLGYSFGSTLVYATAGVARSQTRYESPAVIATAVLPASATGRRNSSAFAPVLGVGVEQKLTDQISLKAEVEASPSRRTAINLPAGRTNVENRQVGAKIGLNYHF